MRKWIFAAVIGLAGAGNAWAQYPGDPYRTLSDQVRDQRTVRSAPMAFGLDTKEDVENYLRQKDEYDQAVQRLTLDEMRQMREEARQAREEERERRTWEQIHKDLHD